MVFVNQYDVVFLEVVVFVGDIGGDFEVVGQVYVGNFMQC